MTVDERRQRIFQLVALGDVDKLRREVMKLVEAVPRVLASRQRGSKEAAEAVEAQKEKLQGFKAHLKNLELDLAEREESLLKANANLQTAKSNQEYSLLIGEIERKKEDKSGVETTVLEQYDVIRQGEQLVKDAQDRLEAAQEEYREFERRASDELKERQRELAALDERREQVRKAIDPEVLKIYDRAFDALGAAIVPAEANTCQGCFSTLTPNDRNRLLAARELVVCRSCQRILYMPEALQASPS